MRSLLWRALFAVVACQALAQPVGAQDEPREATSTVFARYSDRILKIQIIETSSSAKRTIGTGFFVSADGLMVTNYHVISDRVQEPDDHRVEIVEADGSVRAVEVVAVDVVHDLAVLRTGRASPSHFTLGTVPLRQGDRLYSLGHPNDLGLSIVEGTYNGNLKHTLYPKIHFTGSINPGMSGGPTITNDGRVVGVNVSKRLDGELVSFLIPAEFAVRLLERGRDDKPLRGPAHAEITRQLLAHQALLSQRFTSSPLKLQKHGGYQVPVPDDALARCWGRGRDPDSKGFEVERTDCRVDSQVFAGEFTTGFVRVRHEAYDAPRYSALRFARRYSESFRNERFASRPSRHKTSAECTERFVERDGLPIRAVVCINAYRKLPGLYDVSVLMTTLNRPRQGVQGRLDANGVSFENGLKLVQYYLDGYRWEAAP